MQSQPIIRQTQTQQIYSSGVRTGEYESESSLAPESAPIDDSWQVIDISRSAEATQAYEYVKTTLDQTFSLGKLIKTSSQYQIGGYNF